MVRLRCHRLLVALATCVSLSAACGDGSSGLVPESEDAFDVGPDVADFDSAPSDVWDEDAEVEDSDARVDDTRVDAVVDDVEPSPDGEDDSVDGELAEPAALVVAASADSVAVAERFTVRCRAEFPDGEPADGVPTRVVNETPSTALRDDSGAWYATSVGQARFRCVDERAVLPEPNPITIEVTAGDPVRLVTEVEPAVVSAGQRVEVLCHGFDEFGAALGELELPVVARDSSTNEVVASAAPGDSLVLTRAAIHAVACSSPSATHIDSATVEVVAATTVGLTIEPTEISLIAGEWQTFYCTGQDAFGNETGPDDDARVDFTVPESMSRSPQTRGREFRAFVVADSGPYTVRCESDSVVALNRAQVDLEPAEVTRMSGWVTHNGTGLDEAFPRVLPGSFVFPRYSVSDRWHNRIAMYPLGDFWEVSLAPEGRPAASGWYVDDPGTYLFTLVWNDEVAGTRVELTVPFFVDAGGPLLSCASPANGEWSDAIPGDALSFRVGATDTSSVASVHIDGVPATLSDDGLWETDRLVQPGVNLVDVQAEDDFGVQSAVACAFVAGYGYAETETSLASTAAISLGNDALDDGDRTDALDSLADLLLATLAGEEFAGSLEGPLTETHPLFSDSLDLGLVTIEASVVYDGGFSIDGPNDAVFRVADGAIDLELTIRSLGLNVEVDLGFLGSSSGRITAPRIATSATIGFEVVDGVASAIVTDLPPTEVDELTAAFDRVIFDTAFGLAESSLRADLATQLDATLETALAELVAASVVDPEAFSIDSEFDIESLTPGGPVLPARLVAGLGAGGGEGDDLVLRLDSRFEVDAARIQEAPGVPLVTPGEPPPDVDGVGVFISPTLLNQGFVALWEAGFFEATLFDFGVLFGFAPGATIGEFTIAPQLPPLVSLRDGRVVLTLGAVSSDFLDFFYGEGVVDARISAEVSALPVVGEDGQLAFEDVRVERALASMQPISATPDDYARIIDGFLDATLDGFVTEIFSSTLPQLPTLSLPGSDDLEPFGLGPDDVLTITSPTAYATDDWIVLEGPLGIE